MNAPSAVTISLIYTFTVFFVLSVAGMVFFNGQGINFIVILASNFLFFGVSIFVLRKQRRAMMNPNPNVFIRRVMSGMMFKMGIVLAAVMAYVFLAGKGFNKPAIYISLLLYLVYLAVEVAAVMKLNKRKNV